MADYYGTIIFCDDIRQEIGGKMTLVGCYGPELVVAEALPVTLPKLGFHVRVLIPFEAGHKFGTIKIALPDQDFENAAFSADFDLDEREGGQPSRPTPTDDPIAPPLLSMVLNTVLSPIRLSEGDIRVQAWADDRLVKCGRLHIRRATPDELRSMAMP